MNNEELYTGAEASGNFVLQILEYASKTHGMGFGTVDHELCML